MTSSIKNVQLNTRNRCGIVISWAVRIVISCCVFPAEIIGQTVSPPGLLNHQGRIAVDGLNFDGLGEFKFALVNGAGDTSLWSNDGTSTGGAQPTASVAVTVTKGHYALLLGEAPMTEIPSTVFSGNADVRLRIWFSSDNGNTFAQLSPDRRITPVGYAMVAKTAMIAQSVIDSSVTSASIVDGTITSADLAGNIGVWNLSGGNISFSGGDVLIDGNMEFAPSTATQGVVRSGASDTLLHTFGEENTFFGINAGNLTLTGTGNTGLGEDSLGENSTGNSNTGIGRLALMANTTGNVNTAVGNQALRDNVAGKANTAVGVVALSKNTSGDDNTAVGRGALEESTTGNQNTALGRNALLKSETGSFNTAIGESSLTFLTDGSSNIGLGRNSGLNLTSGSYNILIGNPGLAEDSSTIRIGDFNQTRTFIAGVRNVVPDQNDGLPVIIDSAGQLGTVDAITSQMLADGSVNSNHLAAGAVTSTSIADGAVGQSQLSPGSAAANLNASGQSGVPTGGLVLSLTENPALADSGYTIIGEIDSPPESWSEVTDVALSAERYYHSAVWADGEMLIWGGAGGSGKLGDGLRYNPGTDRWSSISITNAPSPRILHTAIWTGSEMIVWGGNNSGPLNDGGRYDPVNDLWTPTSAAGAPEARNTHTAVWTGSEMIIWGGARVGGIRLDSGMRYNPDSNSWSLLLIRPSNTFRSIPDVFTPEVGNHPFRLLL